MAVINTDRDTGSHCYINAKLQVNCSSLVTVHSRSSACLHPVRLEQRHQQMKNAVRCAVLCMLLESVVILLHVLNCFVYVLCHEVHSCLFTVAFCNDILSMQLLRSCIICWLQKAMSACEVKGKPIITHE